MDTIKSLRDKVSGIYKSLVPFRSGFIAEYAVTPEEFQVTASYKSKYGYNAYICGLAAKATSLGPISVIRLGMELPGLVDKKKNTQLSFFENEMGRALTYLEKDWVLNPTHPEQLWKGAQAHTAVNKMSVSQWENGKGVDMKTVSTSANPYSSSGEDNMYGEMTVLGSKKDTPDLVTWLQANGDLPKFQLSSNNFGKLGKYLNHSGVVIAKVTPVYVNETFPGDGVAYVCETQINKLLINAKAIATQVENHWDSELKTIITQYVEMLEEAWNNYYVMGRDTSGLFKGWSSGQFAFGKGMIRIVPEDTWNKLNLPAEKNGNPVLAMDENWAKFKDDAMNGVGQYLYLHACNKAGKSQTLSYSSIERFVGTQDGMNKFLRILLETIPAKTADLDTNGLEALFDPDSLEFHGECNREATMKALSAWLIKHKFIGLSGYALPVTPGADSIEDKVVVNPVHRHMFKGDFNGVLYRFPALNAAGAKKVPVEFSSHVPVNGIEAPVSFMDDLMMDHDGDTIYVAPMASEFGKLFNDLDNVTMPALKGLKQLDSGNSTNGSNPTRASILARTAVSQKAVALADTVISSRISPLLGANDRIAQVNATLDVAISMQQFLDGIKKPTATLPELSISNLSDQVRLLKGKCLDIHSRSVEENFPIDFTAKQIAKVIAHYTIQGVKEVKVASVNPVLLVHLKKKYNSVISPVIKYSKMEGNALTPLFGEGQLMIQEMLVEETKGYFVLEDGSFDVVRANVLANAMHQNKETRKVARQFVKAYADHGLKIDTELFFVNLPSEGVSDE